MRASKRACLMRTSLELSEEDEDSEDEEDPELE